jgi:mono/diheme cytochrome c family protein
LRNRVVVSKPLTVGSVNNRRVRSVTVAVQSTAVSVSRPLRNHDREGVAALTDFFTVNSARNRAARMIVCAKTLWTAPFGHGSESTLQQNHDLTEPRPKEAVDWTRFLHSLVSNRLFIGAGALAFLSLAACRQDMHDQPRYKPLAESQFFADHRASRPQVEGTVARGHLRIDDARYTGKIGGEDIDQFPIPITKADIERGQARFNIYCTPCHGRVGDGNGMVVLRGYRQAASFYTDKLVHAPTGHFFDVITNGFGAMPSYASRIQPDDRWRVIAYIRALELSESASLNDVPADQRQNMIVEPPPRGIGPGTAPANPPGARPQGANQ